jgi:hypothetical protein
MNRGRVFQRLCPIASPPMSWDSSCRFCCTVWALLPLGQDRCGWRPIEDGNGASGRAVQVPTIHCPGDPPGGASVSPNPHQLPRSRAYAAGSRRLGRSHHHFPVINQGPCRKTGEADPAASANEQRLVARARNLCEGQRPLDLSVSSGRYPGPDYRLPVLGQARCRSGQALLRQRRWASLIP